MEACKVYLLLRTKIDKREIDVNILLYMQFIYCFRFIKAHHGENTQSNNDIVNN